MVLSIGSEGHDIGADHRDLMIGTAETGSYSRRRGDSHTVQSSILVLRVLKAVSCLEQVVWAEGPVLVRYIDLLLVCTSRMTHSLTAQRPGLQFRLHCSERLSPPSAPCHTSRMSAVAR